MTPWWKRDDLQCHESAWAFRQLMQMAKAEQDAPRQASVRPAERWIDALRRQLHSVLWS